MRRADLDYMSEMRAAMARRPLVSANLLLLAVFLFFVGFVFWARQAVLEEVTVGLGRVIPTGQEQVVQNLEGGILKAILVREGEEVRQGAVLLRLDDTQFSSNLQEVRAEFLGLQAAIVRLEAESEARAMEEMAEYETLDPEYAGLEQALYNARKAEFDAAIAVLRRQAQQRRLELEEKRQEAASLQISLSLAREEKDITEPMVKRGVAPRVELVRLLGKISEMEGKLKNAKNAYPRIRSAIAEAEDRITEKQRIWMTDAQRQLNEKRQRFRTLEESLKSLQDRVVRTEITAPVNGTVKRVLVTTLGGVVQPGMPLVEIVPSDDTLLIEAQIRPEDVAFLHPGQKATVKLTAFDFSIYGGLEATLVHISADTIQDPAGDRFYEIRVRTDRNYLERDGRRFEIIPGMVAEVDILTGTKTVMDYLLKPILKARERALRER